MDIQYGFWNIGQSEMDVLYQLCFFLITYVISCDCGLLCFKILEIFTVGLTVNSVTNQANNWTCVNVEEHLLAVFLH